jgi:hypothetical protein
MGKMIMVVLNPGFHLSATSTAQGPRGLDGFAKSKKKGGEFK